MSDFSSSSSSGPLNPPGAGQGPGRLDRSPTSSDGSTANQQDGREGRAGGAQQTDRAVQPRHDPAVALSPSLTKVKAGDQVEGRVVALDGDGRPILETPRGQFSLRPDLGLALEDRARIRITDVDRQIRGELIARAGKPVQPPQPVRLTLVALPTADAEVSIPPGRTAEQPRTTAYATVVGRAATTSSAVSNRPTLPYEAASLNTTGLARPTAAAPEIAPAPASQSGPTPSSASTTIPDAGRQAPVPQGQDIRPPVTGTTVRQPVPTALFQLNETGSASPQATAGSASIPLSANHPVQASPPEAPVRLAAFVLEATDLKSLDPAARQAVARGAPLSLVIPAGEIARASQQPLTPPAAQPGQQVATILSLPNAGSLSGGRTNLDGAASQPTPSPATAGAPAPATPSPAGTPPSGSLSSGQQIISTEVGLFAVTLPKALPVGVKLLVTIEAPQRPTGALAEGTPRPSGPWLTEASRGAPRTDQAQSPVGPSPSSSSGSAYRPSNTGYQTSNSGSAQVAPKVGDDLSPPRPGQPLAPAEGLALRPLTPAASLPLSQMTEEWPVFTQLSHLLGQTQGPAFAEVGNRAPPSATNIPKALFFFLAAAGRGDPSQWLGQSARALLADSGNGALLEKIDQDVGRLMRLVSDPPQGEWRPVMLPWQGDGQNGLITLLVKSWQEEPPGGGGQERGTDPEDDSQQEARRFIVDVRFSNLGPVQLDGLLKQGRFDLVIRSQRPLPPGLEPDIRGLFTSALETSGHQGRVSFQVGQDFTAMVKQILTRADETAPHEPWTA